ncbi:MAG: HDOD domain-containing protein [Syntrophorhabdales bacterium]|jgi:putative nucleotidyltransferase with HDIG domain
MDLKTLKDRIETVQTLATIPAVASRLLELVADPTVSLAEISRFVSHDPVLATKVLRMVNSPIYGFPGRISSVNQAVLLLGLNVVRGLLIGVSVFDLMQQTMIGLWEHSLGCAILARLISKKKGLRDTEEISIHGLLHDIGKVVLVLQFPKEYEKVMSRAQAEECTVYEAEDDYFPTTHATVGAWIAEQWSFPRRLIDVIACHHRPQLSKVAPMETAIVHFADILLRSRGFGFAGDFAVPLLHPSSWELIGLSESDIGDILKESEDLLEEAADLAL